MQPRYSNDQVPSTLLCIQPAVITLIWVQQRATRHYRGKMPYVKYELLTSLLLSRCHLLRYNIQSLLD